MRRTLLRICLILAVLSMPALVPLAAQPPARIAAESQRVWNERAASDLVMSRLRGYGGVGRYGFSDYVSEDVPMRHAIVGFYDLKGLGMPVRFAVASSAPSRDFECHACAPRLSLHLFVFSNHRWMLQRSYFSDPINWGQWGEGPSKDEVVFLLIGPGWPALLLKGAGGGQGYFSANDYLYLIERDRVKEIFHAEVHEDDAGTGENRVDWNGEIYFNSAILPIHDIVYHRFGRDGGKAVDRWEVYRFDGDKYRKVYEGKSLKGFYGASPSLELIHRYHPN